MIPIIEFEQEYFITKSGIIYRQGKIKPLKQHCNKQNNYWQVNLWKNNKGHRKYTHRLLAEHFIPNPKNKPEVNHINSNRQDNSLKNLEWVTSSENSIHAYTHGYASQKMRRNLIEQDYKDIFSRFLLGESFGQILKNYQISPGRLSMNLRNLVKKWGYMAEYDQEVLRQRQIRARINGGKNGN